MDLVNRYSQLVNLSVQERLIDNGATRTLEMSIGDLKVSVSETFAAGVTRKVLKKKACELFVSLYSDEINRIFLPKYGFDYLQFSVDNVLENAKVYMNVAMTFKPQIVAFDSEGKPPTLVQLCVDENTVYLYTDFEMCKHILEDDSILKVVCDGHAEEKNFLIHNMHDLQGKERKSLVRCIHETFGINLIKDKRIHYRGWNLPLKQSQLDYAVADVIWMWKIYHAKIK